VCAYSMYYYITWFSSNLQCSKKLHSLMLMQFHFNHKKQLQWMTTTLSSPYFTLSCILDVSQYIVPVLLMCKDYFYTHNF